jgi:hypothetical protein
MELEIYEAFTSAGVSEVKAKAAVESINREIDKRYSLHSAQLATKGDLSEVKAELAEVKADIIKWVAGLLLAQTALIGTLIKLMELSH